MSDSVLLDKELLDHQLLDANGRRCGNVDDLELEESRDGDLVVAAILSGPGLFRDRLPHPVAVYRGRHWFLVQS